MASEEANLVPELGGKAQQQGPGQEVREQACRRQRAAASACWALAVLAVVATAVGGTVASLRSELKGTSFQPRRLHIDASEGRERLMLRMDVDVTKAGAARHAFYLERGSCTLSFGQDGQGKRDLVVDLVSADHRSDSQVALVMEVQHENPEDLVEAAMLAEVTGAVCDIRGFLDPFKVGAKLPVSHRLNLFEQGVATDAAPTEPVTAEHLEQVTFRLVPSEHHVQWPTAQQHRVAGSMVLTLEVAAPLESALAKRVEDLLRKTAVTVEAGVNYTEAAVSALSVAGKIEGPLRSKHVDDKLVLELDLEVSGRSDLAASLAGASGIAWGLPAKGGRAPGEFKLILEAIQGLRQRVLTFQATKPNSLLATALGPRHSLGLVPDPAFPEADDLADAAMAAGRALQSLATGAPVNKGPRITLHQMLSLNNETTVLRADVKADLGVLKWDVLVGFAMRTRLLTDYVVPAWTSSSSVPTGVMLRSSSRKERSSSNESVSVEFQLTSEPRKPAGRLSLRLSQMRKWTGSSEYLSSQTFMESGTSRSSSETRNETTVRAEDASNLVRASVELDWPAKRMAFSASADSSNTFGNLMSTVYTRMSNLTSPMSFGPTIPDSNSSSTSSNSGSMFNVNFVMDIDGNGTQGQKGFGEFVLDIAGLNMVSFRWNAAPEGSTRDIHRITLSLNPGSTSANSVSQVLGVPGVALNAAGGPPVANGIWSAEGSPNAAVTFEQQLSASATARVDFSNPNLMRMTSTAGSTMTCGPTRASSQMMENLLRGVSKTDAQCLTCTTGGGSYWTCSNFSDSPACSMRGEPNPACCREYRYSGASCMRFQAVSCCGNPLSIVAGPGGAVPAELVSISAEMPGGSADFLTMKGTLQVNSADPAVPFAKATLNGSATGVGAVRTLTIDVPPLFPSPFFTMDFWQDAKGGVNGTAQIRMGNDPVTTKIYMQSGTTTVAKVSITMANQALFDMDTMLYQRMGTTSSDAAVQAKIVTNGAVWADVRVVGNTSTTNGNRAEVFAVLQGRQVANGTTSWGTSSGSSKVAIPGIFDLDMVRSTSRMSVTGNIQGMARVQASTVFTDSSSNNSTTTATVWDPSGMLVAQGTCNLTMLAQNALVALAATAPDGTPMLTAQGTLPYQGGFMVGDVSAMAMGGSMNVRVNASKGMLPVTRADYPGLTRFDLSLSMGMGGMSLTPAIYMEDLPTFVGPMGSTSALGASLRVEEERSGLKVPMSTSLVDIELFRPASQAEAAQILEGQGSTTRVPTTVVTTELTMEDPTTFNQDKYLAQLALVTGADTSKMTVTSVLYSVVVSYSLGSEVTTAQAKTAIARANAVPETAVTVAVTRGRGRRLAAVDVQATIAADSADAAKTLKVSAANPTLLTQALQQQSIQTQATVVQQPSAKVVVETAVRAQQVNQPSSAQLEQMGTNLGATIKMTMTSTTQGGLISHAPATAPRLLTLLAAGLLAARAA